jgi:tetratricopeptide (TPR) repeat protein
VAKSPRAGGKVVTKNFGGVKGKRPEFPVNAAESDATADKQAKFSHYSILAGCVLLDGAALAWGGHQIYSGATAHPPSTVSIFWGALTLVAAIFITRSLLWLSIIVPAMFAAKNKGWQSLEQLCRQGLAMSQLFPGNALTLSLMLVQSLLTRGELDQAIALGTEQDKLYANNPKSVDLMGPLYTSMGMAEQAKGNVRQAIPWNEKAIAAFLKTLEKNATEKKNWLRKLAESQGGDVSGNLKTQLTVAYFNNATSYFNTMNYRVAKSNFQKAIETAAQAPEFPEKADIVKASREAMTRLKHN